MAMPRGLDIVQLVRRHDFLSRIVWRPKHAGIASASATILTCLVPYAATHSVRVLNTDAQGKRKKRAAALLDPGTVRSPHLRGQAPLAIA